MPELPEVESYRRFVDRHALGKTIDAVEVRDRRILRRVTPENLRRTLRGHHFVSTLRHGKNLWIETTGDVWLYLHFGMTGEVAAWAAGEDEPRFSRVVFRFGDGGFFAFVDARLFGEAGFTDDPGEEIFERKLGVDPLSPEFTAERLTGLLARRGGAIKPLLMRQDLVAGLGNLYVDEALFRSGIHPLHSAVRLRRARIATLHAAITEVLEIAIDLHESGGDYPDDFLTAHRSEGARCPRCGGPIRKIVVGSRSTYFCARHQRPPV